MDQNQPSTTVHKKRRAYAAQAYEFGANSSLTPLNAQQLPPSQHGTSVEPLQSQLGMMSIDSSTDGQYSNVPSYQNPGAQPYLNQPVSGIDSQMIQPAPMPVIPQSQPTHQLNQLYPSDLSQQPFNAYELSLPPPPIQLPPNSSVTSSPYAECPPKYIRSTINAVPTTNSLLKKSKLPFALVIQPYTSLHDVEDPVPLITDQIISRCRRCRSYINPFVTFLDQGHRWRCNMCGLINDVSQAFDWDSAAQKPADRWLRAELNYSVVEFLAPQEYMVRAPQPLVYLFLIDVSFAAVSNGLVATAARCIMESLDRIPNADSRTKLGFICVDNALNYFAISRNDSEQSGLRMLVVNELEELFLPLPNDLVVSLAECRANIVSFLEKLQAIFQNSQSSSNAMGSALRAGYRLIQQTGGKLVVISASLPNVGHAKLEMREDKKLLGTSKEISLLQTANNFYKSFAVECSKNQVSVDMFLFSSQYQDVASLSQLPRFTGGQTYFYPGWNAARPEDAIKFAREFSDYLSVEIGLEAVLRVRATNGLRVCSFYGNLFNRSSDLCAFPAFPRDQAYVVEVLIEETVTRPVACLQAAVLHTTCNGERRIRVITLGLPTTDSLSTVFASADQGAIITYFSHKAVEKAFNSGLDAARDSLQSKLIDIMQTYRKELAGGNMGFGGIQLPANLRGLPALILGLMKNVALRKSTLIPSDLRSAALCLISTLPAPLMIQYIYPHIYSLHDMPDDAGTPDEKTGEIILPVVINASSDRLVRHGLYLFDDGQNQFLWVGSGVVDALVLDVFGVSDKSMIRQGKGTLPQLDNDFNERVRAVIEKSGSRRWKAVGSITFPSLYIVREDGEPSLRLWAQSLLVEDGTDQSMGYLQWLGFLREKVS